MSLLSAIILVLVSLAMIRGAIDLIATRSRPTLTTISEAATLGAAGLRTLMDVSLVATSLMQDVCLTQPAETLLGFLLVALFSTSIIALYICCKRWISDERLDTWAEQCEEWIEEQGGFSCPQLFHNALATCMAWLQTICDDNKTVSNDDDTLSEEEIVLSDEEIVLSDDDNLLSDNDGSLYSNVPLDDLSSERAQLEREWDQLYRAKDLQQREQEELTRAWGFYSFRMNQWQDDRDQLEWDRDQLQCDRDKLHYDRDQLQRDRDNLQIEFDHLKHEMEQLHGEWEDLHHGWDSLLRYMTNADPARCP